MSFLLVGIVLTIKPCSSFATSNNDNVGIESRKNIIKWRFNYINGHLQKIIRLFGKEMDWKYGLGYKR